MSSAEFKNASREHTSLLAGVEKRFLIATAKIIPRAINSDHLTSLGFVALLAAGACYAWARWYPLALLWVIPCLVLNWFGDSLDGTLARVRNQQRPRYGFYVDHILDAIGSAVLFCGLGASGYLSPGVAGAFLIVYLLLSIEIYLATYTIGKFHLSYWRFGPTELRILLIAGNIAAVWHPYAAVAGRRLLLFDIGFGIGTVVLAVILVQASIRHTRQLYDEERLPRG